MSYTKAYTLILSLSLLVFSTEPLLGSAFFGEENEAAFQNPFRSHSNHKIANGILRFDVEFNTKKQRFNPSHPMVTDFDNLAKLWEDVKSHFMSEFGRTLQETYGELSEEKDYAIPFFEASPIRYGIRNTGTLTFKLKHTPETEFPEEMRRFTSLDSYFAPA